MKDLARAFAPPIPKKDLQALIQKAVAQIIKVPEVKSLYLFGSASRGGADAYSDLDFLVVVDSSADTKKAYSDLIRGVHLDEIPVEFVCVDRSTFDRKSEVGGVCFLAKHHGVRLFDR